MNKKNYVAVATLAFAMLTSCAGQKEAKSTSGMIWQTWILPCLPVRTFSVTHVEDGTMHIR